MGLDFSKEVTHVARLARLHLTGDEKERLAGQLGSILETARKVREADTDGVEPTAHVLSRPAAFREDVTRPSLPLNRVLQNAHRRERDYFRVPRITPGEQEE